MKTKSKLMVAVVMLVISAIMMSTASFAWFTISTAPEVKGMTAQTVVNENLEMALVKSDTATTVPDSATSKTGDAYTWGNLIDLGVSTKLDGTAGTNEFTSFMTDYDSTATGDQAVVLRPATYVATAAEGVTVGFKAPTYGADGRINAANGMALTPDQATSKGFGILKDTSDNVYGYYVDYWIRSNVGGTLALTDAVDRANDGADTVTGTGSYVVSADASLKGNVNVAFSIIGSKTNAAGAQYAAVANPTVVPATNLGTAITGIDNSSKLTCTEIANMAANTAYVLRCYVYLEGATVTNADASIDGTLKQATVNLQFAINGVTNNMIVPTT